MGVGRREGEIVFNGGGGGAGAGRREGEIVFNGGEEGRELEGGDSV